MELGGIELGGIAFDDELDHDDEMYVQAVGYITKQEAIVIVEHLKKVFELKESTTTLDKG